MKFWRRLRWLASITFIALLVLSWLGTDSTTPEREAERHVAPTFYR